MSFNLKEERPAEGLSITHSEDSKFNTETIIVRFITPVDEKESPKRWLAVSMLTDGTADFPDKLLISKRLAELYGASLFSFSYKSGNSQVSGITMNCIGDKYTMNGEQITADCAKLLLDSIFKPNMKNGVFDELLFENARNELLNKIRSAADNRHSYAYRRAVETAFEGEPSAISLHGTEEYVSALTAEDISAAYEDMLTNSYISVSFCGGGTNTEAQKLVTERLTAFAEQRGSTNEYKKLLYAASKPKEQAAVVTEQIEQKQSKIFLIYKYDNTDEFAMVLAVSIFGSTPTSKLFMNVREKLSLCYYVSAALILGKDAVYVDCGVAPGNEEKAVSEIKRQLELMQQGEITDDEIADAKRSYINSLRSINDFGEEQNSWFFRRFVKGDLLTPQEAEELVSAVTKERIIDAVKSFRLDTVYTLEPTDCEGGEADE